MRTQLNISQRWGAIVLLSMLNEGSFKELRTVKNTLKLLTVTDKEKKEYGLEVKDKQVIWNKKTELKEKEFTFDDALFPLMRRHLLRLSEEGRLRSEMYDIAEKLGIE